MSKLPWEDHTRLHPIQADVSGKRKPIAPTIPRHILYTWAWLGCLSFFLIVFSIMVIVLWFSWPSPIVQKTITPQPPPLVRQKVHAYPFNVYDATPGKVARYPSGDSLGVTGLSWETVSWYRVCCKTNQVFQCFPTDAVALRKMNGSNVFLEIKHTSLSSTPSWEPIGGIGARCTLYWMDGKLTVEN